MLPKYKCAKLNHTNSIGKSKAIPWKNNLHCNAHKVKTMEYEGTDFPSIAPPQIKIQYCRVMLSPCLICKRKRVDAEIL
jgi:hypothetical protein